MTEIPVLSLEDVHYSVTTKPILTGLSLHVTAGESVVILGRSGSGKSTLLTIALGLLSPRHGRVTISGTDLYALGRGARATFRSKHIGMVFQHAELLPELSALENVALPALLTGESRNEAVPRAATLLDRLEVPHLTLAADLSGGEQQRTALARALINSPNLILADEPTGSLDAELRDTAADQLFELPAKTGCGLVVVTHDPSIAARAQRTYVLNSGALALQQSERTSRSAPGTGIGEGQQHVTQR